MYAGRAGLNGALRSVTYRLTRWFEPLVAKAFGPYFLSSPLIGPVRVNSEDERRILLSAIVDRTASRDVVLCRRLFRVFRYWVFIPEGSCLIRTSAVREEAQVDATTAGISVQSDFDVGADISFYYEQSAHDFADIETAEWEVACGILEDAGVRKRSAIVAFAASRLLLWHLMQPMVYLAVFTGEYDQMEDANKVFGTLLACREVLYALLALYGSVVQPSYLLYSPSHGMLENPLLFVYFVFAPEKFVCRALAKGSEQASARQARSATFLFTLGQFGFALGQFVPSAFRVSRFLLLVWSVVTMVPAIGYIIGVVPCGVSSHIFFRDVFVWLQRDPNILGDGSDNHVLRSLLILFVDSLLFYTVFCFGLFVLLLLRCDRPTTFGFSRGLVCACLWTQSLLTESCSWLSLVISLRCHTINSALIVGYSITVFGGICVMGIALVSLCFSYARQLLRL